MAKKIDGYLKLQVPAGKANPSPPIGPALGQRGINIMEFCKAFNAATQGMESGMPIPTIITIYKDKSFSFETKTAPASYFLRKAVKLKKGSAEPGRHVVGTVSKRKIREIAQAKMIDLNANTIEQAMKIIEGSARSMGLAVEGSGLDMGSTEAPVKDEPEAEAAAAAGDGGAPAPAREEAGA